MLTVIKTTSVCILIMLFVLQYGKSRRLYKKLYIARKKLMLTGKKLKEFDNVKKEQQLSDAYNNGYEDAINEFTYRKRVI